MDTSSYRGIWTALITPFESGNGLDNPVDYSALDRLLQMQIDGGVTGVLFLGTTAENPTLSTAEGMEIVRKWIEKLEGKTKVMVNIGTYATGKTIENIHMYDTMDGIDAYLVVNPYYNKPTQTGLYEHFVAAAKSTQRPVVLYNIKGRTGVNLETDTLLRIIAAYPNVIGVKEASGDIDQMQEVIDRTPDSFLVLSGDDGLTYELAQRGGDGVISVASNCIPGDMADFVHLSLQKDPHAKELAEYFTEFFDKLFIQTNPLPAKTYLAHKGIIQETFRLPMCPMDAHEKKIWLDFVEEKKL